MKITYQFGPFRLDPAERRKRFATARPSPSRRKHSICSSPSWRTGHLMKKSSSSNGSGTASCVEKVNLAQNVSAIRRVLGGKQQGVVQTVAGIGYRFLRPLKRLVLHRMLPPPPQHRLIVLPFPSVEEADEETAFLAFSLPDALTASLSGLDSMQGGALDLVAATSATTRRTGTHREGSPPSISCSPARYYASAAASSVGGTRECVGWHRDVVAHPEQAALGDLASLRDRIVERIITLLELRLTARERQMLRRSLQTQKATVLFEGQSDRARGARIFRRRSGTS